MNHYIKSILIGIALDYPGVQLGELHKKNCFYIRNPIVGVIQVWGELQFEKGKTYVKWDLMHSFNKRNYEKAKEELMKLPIPYENC